MSALIDHEQTSSPASVRPDEKSDDQTPPAAALPHAAKRTAAAIVIQKACREYLERKSIRESKDAPTSSAVGCELVKGIEQPSGPCVVCLEAPLGDAKPIADTPIAQDETTLVLNGTEEQNQTALHLGHVPVDRRPFRVTASSGGHFEGKSDEAIAKLFNSRSRSKIDADHEVAAVAIQRAFRKWKTAKRSSEEVQQTVPSIHKNER